MINKINEIYLLQEMNNLIERSLIFPKINQSKRYLQRAREGKQLSRHIIMQLKQNHSSSLYNLGQSKLEEEHIKNSLKKRTSQPKIHKVKKKLMLPDQIETQKQPSQKKDFHLIKIMGDSRTARRLNTQRYQAKQYEYDAKDQVTPLLGQYHRAIIIQSPFHYKFFKKRIEGIEQIRESKFVQSDQHSGNRLINMLNVKRLNNLESRAAAVKIYNTPKRIDRKPYFLKDVNVNVKAPIKPQRKVTEIVGWKTEEQNY